MRAVPDKWFVRTHFATVQYPSRDIKVAGEKTNAICEQGRRNILTAAIFVVITVKGRQQARYAGLTFMCSLASFASFFSGQKLR